MIQNRNGGGIFGAGAQGFGHWYRQYWVRADFDEGAAALFEQGCHGVFESHRLTQIAIPVGGIEGIGAHVCAGDGRVERNIPGREG